MAEKDTNPGEQDPEQFNSMLNAAQKHVGNQNASGSLTQAQIEAMLAVNDDDEDEDDKTQPVSDDETEMLETQTADGEDAAIADKLREGLTADSQAAAEETEQKQKKKKEKKVKVKKEKKPMDKATLAKLLTAAAIIVAAVLGYCVCLFFFTDAIKTPAQEFAIRSAKAVNSKLSFGTEMYVYKAYVRSSKSSDECMLYAITSSKDAEKTDMYHVVIYHDQPNKINVYYTLDAENPEYIRMRDSEDEKLRIQASNLKHYSDEIVAADKEIQINSPEWVRIDSVVVNKNMKETSK